MSIFGASKVVRFEVKINEAGVKVGRFLRKRRQSGKARYGDHALPKARRTGLPRQSIATVGAQRRQKP